MSAALTVSTPAPVLLDTGEAAKRVRISKRTLERMLYDGRGPRVTRIGARVLISEADLNAWIESCRVERPARCA